jgi:antitoxin VapB
VQKDRTPKSINVKDPEALRERYERLQRRHRKAAVEELLAIADRAAALVKRPYVDHAELLYDEHGLPK